MLRSFARTGLPLLIQNLLISMMLLSTEAAPRLSARACE